jgi:cation diffusion facilitator CzcD-associated flavoprotein CzcO
LQDPDAIIVGAGPAGLACAVTMRAAGLDVIVVEKADSVGSVWRRHYDRLHLHTDRKHSGLPGMVMPKTYPLYPAREQLVEYLENYAARLTFGLLSIRRRLAFGVWGCSGAWNWLTARSLLRLW